MATLFYRGSSFNMPLYLYPDDGMQTRMDYQEWPRGVHGRIPNLDREFVGELTRKTGLTFLPDQAGDLKSTYGPEDVLSFIYAVLHSPAYRARYAEFLRIDFPRIGFPRDRDAFRALCAVGHELMDLHLMISPILSDDRRLPTFPQEGNNTVESGYPIYVVDADKPQKAAVYINEDQYFAPIAPYIWDFYVGGYQVCEKWLKDRRGAELSYDDVHTYQKIVAAIDETVRLVDARCMHEVVS